MTAVSSHAHSPYLCHKGLFGKRMVQVDSCAVSSEPTSPHGHCWSLAPASHIMPPDLSTAMASLGAWPKGPVASSSPSSMQWSCLPTQAFSISKVWRLSKVCAIFSTFVFSMLDVWVFLYLCVSSRGQMFAGDNGSQELRTGPIPRMSHLPWGHSSTSV